MDRKSYTQVAVPHIYCMVNQSDVVVKTTMTKRMHDSKGQPMTDTTYYLEISFDQMVLELALNQRQATLFGDLILQSLAEAHDGVVLNEKRLEFHDYDLDDEE